MSIKPPDYSFKSEVPLSSVMDQIANKNVRRSQLDQSEQQQRQSKYDTLHQVVADASKTVQTMVEASKQRQHRDALNVIASLLSKGGEQVPAPGALPSGIQGPQPETTAIPLSQTPAYQAQMDAALFKGAPDVAMKQQLEKIYSERTQNDQAKSWAPAKTWLVDGQPRAVSANSATGAIRDFSTHEILNGHKIEPYTPPSTYGAVREELGTQANLSDMVKQIKSELTSSPNAKVVVAADNFGNQVDRVLKGEVTADKTTMTALMTELDRALSSGVSSEKRMEGLMPKTFRGSFANFETYITNNPTSQEAQQFLRNLRVEAKAAGDQRRAGVENIIKPILASAKLAQRKDPQGFKETVEALGLDAEAAKSGKLKFRPHAYSVFYGEGYNATGAPLPPAGGGTDLGNGFSYTVKK